MNRLQKRAIERVIEILQEGYHEVISIGISEKSDAELLADIKAVSTTGSLANRILHKFGDAEQWLKDVLNEK